MKLFKFTSKTFNIKQTPNQSLIQQKQIKTPTSLQNTLQQINNQDDVFELIINLSLPNQSIQIEESIKKNYKQKIYFSNIIIFPTLEQESMKTSRTFKNGLYDTKLSYQSAQTNADRSFNVDEQNVVPCAARIQSFISSLNKKKYEAKGLIIERQKYNQINNDQQARLQSESIKQSYCIQKEEDLLKQNTKILDEIEFIKEEKIDKMKKMISLKKCLESRFQQIMQMKKLCSQLQQQSKCMELRRDQMQVQNDELNFQKNQLDLMSQNLDNEVYQMRQTVRQSEVGKTTVQSALNMFKTRIEGTLNDIKGQNKQARTLNGLMTQVSDKVKNLRQQQVQNDINSHELIFRNKQIQNVNIKLRNDLEKCKGHLQCVMRNNEILSNSIEEFSYVDERVSKLVKRNQLKKL